MKHITKEQATEQSRENRVSGVMERIHAAISNGTFEINSELDYIQLEIIEGLGYDCNKIGEKNNKTMYKITW